MNSDATDDELTLENYSRTKKTHQLRNRNKHLQNVQMPLKPKGLDSVIQLTAAEPTPKYDSDSIGSVNKPESNSKTDHGSQYSHSESQVRTKKKSQRDKSKDLTITHSSKSDPKHSSKLFREVKSDPDTISCEKSKTVPNSSKSSSDLTPQAEPRSSKRRSQSRRKSARDLQQLPATHTEQQSSSISTKITSGSEHSQVTKSKFNKSKQPRHSHAKLKVESKQTSAHKTSVDTSLVTELTKPSKPSKPCSSSDKRSERAKRIAATFPESDANQRRIASTKHLKQRATSSDQQLPKAFNKSSLTSSVDKGQKVKSMYFATQTLAEVHTRESAHAHECTCMSKFEYSYKHTFFVSFAKDIKAKRSKCIQFCKEEIAKLTTKLSSDTNVHNVRSLEHISEALQQREAEKKLIFDTIAEVRNRQKVFLHYCEEINTKLNELSGTEDNFPSMIESLYSTFKREVKRYDKGLPIYAHRLAVIDMLQSNQVSILIGETGSGKSTQLVQYLYEAGYSSNGLIVCTQPRKLAAASLAEHVSNEVNEKLGETYDYVDSKRKLGRGARVVFMTDHMLLNECIADPNLRKYSCLVIDEAHERSIHTDILIALIKRCLPHRPNLKVIITSATINPALFSHYFGGEDECPIIEVPGRIHPVRVIWNEAQPSILEQDYVSEAVSKIYDIHVNKRREKGDVLVFLTCPAEIERACKLAQQSLKREAVILPLHGKLQPDEQQKVFEPTPGKRKVIFATNVAETSITIPGIVYVVDTGLSKELCYDPQKNMNSLEIRPISKSSADQRKGRAGRTCPGECYRLYSETDYMNMKNNSVPEILRITLAFAVIKLYEFGIKEIHSFEFVESPDRKALNDAIENLKFLGAIKQGKLTDLGKKMAMLPLEPNLSKVLLDAINKGIGIEAAAAVSISTLAGRVFFRPDTAESQADSVKKILPFCQPTGDQMTYLHTYFEWSRRLGRKDQTKWCVENYVNAKSMRMVQQIVDELRFILNQKWYIDLPPKITSLEQANTLLPKIFFDAFLTNICIHLGHTAVGYWCAKLPDEQLVIYPASSLKQLSSVPQCLVYEKTQKTSQHFLLQALPVREEWIHEAVESGKLLCHPAEHPLFKVHQVKPLLFTNGPWIAWQLYRKYPHDRRISVPEFCRFDIQPVFEHSKNNGTLKIFAQVQNHDQIQTSAKTHIESLKKQLRVESRICGITESKKIVIGLGGCVQHILMPGDVQTIVVRGIDNEEHISKAKTELSSYGECACNSSVNERGIQLYVKFRNPSDALKASSHQFISFHEPNLRTQKCPDKSRRNYCLKVEWCRRRRRDFAFIVFDNDEEFDSLVSPFCHDGDCGYYYYDSPSKLTFARSTYSRSIRVVGTKILLGVSEEYVVSRLLIFLPACTQTDFSVYFIYDTQFEETNGSLSSQQNRLETKLAQCAPPHSYTVIMDRPQPKRVMYRAWIYFEESNECTKMYRYLSEEIALKCIEDDEDSTSESGSESESESESSDDDDSSEDELNWEIIDHVYTLPSKVEIILTYSARYTPKFFSAIEPNIFKVRQKFLLAYACVMIDYDKEDNHGNKFVKLSASDDDVFQSAKKELEKAAEPSVIHCKTELQNQYVSTAAFRVTLKETQEKTLTFMKVNKSSLSMASIAIYGTKKHRKIARSEIQAHLESISQNGIHCFEIDLKTYSPGLMKLLVEMYGFDTNQLSETCEGIVATRLIPRWHILTLFATEAGHQSILSLLSTINPDNAIVQALPLEQFNVSSCLECCVCFSNLHLEQTQPVSYYQLESCGHAYCRECIELQLQSNTITFPVTCAAGECGEELVWKDFAKLVKLGVKKLQDIESASLSAYIISNPHMVRNCITPDCEMVYFVSESSNMYVCDECEVKICSCCHSKWHEGYTCKEFASRHNPGHSLRIWINKDEANHKECPKCNTVIQKVGGCQHVICRCGCHICWNCMQYFASEQECYRHLKNEHGRFT